MEPYDVSNMTDRAYRDLLHQLAPAAFAANYDTDYFPGLPFGKKMMYHAYRVSKALQEYQEEHHPEGWQFAYFYTADLCRVTVVSKLAYPAITAVVAVRLQPYPSVVVEATCGTCTWYHDRMQLLDSAVNDVEVAMFLDPFFAFLKKPQPMGDLALLQARR